MPRALCRRAILHTAPMLRLRQQQRSLRRSELCSSLSGSASAPPAAAAQRRRHSSTAAAAAVANDTLDMQRHTTHNLAEWQSRASPDVRRVLDLALAEISDVSVADATTLLSTRGADAHAVLAVADELRQRAVGEDVTYVVNRNINFTNVCVKRCGFCAFSRTGANREGYFLPLNEVLRRAHEAVELGATEVCIQAGLPPQMDGDLYANICRAIKAELPEIHIHGFSPEEIVYPFRGE